MDTKKKWILFLIVILLVGGYFLATQIFSTLRFVPPKVMRDYITVNEVVEKPEMYDGKIIRLRGKSLFLLETTLLMCCPMSCDCNGTWGSLYLLDSMLPGGAGGFSWDEIILIPDVGCSGNVCSITCSPFSPQDNIEYVLVGKLSVRYRNGEPQEFKLTEVDFISSSYFLNEKWLPITLGTFVETIPTPTPIPGSCEEIR